MKQSVNAAAASGRTDNKYSDQGLAALADAVLESILAETNRTHVRTSEIRQMVVEFFGATLRKASFEVIRHTLNEHPWLTATGGDSFRIQREFDKEPAEVYTGV